MPGWQPALTQQESSQIERVERCTLYIILGVEYINYKNAIEILECEALNDRRVQISEKRQIQYLVHPE